PRRPGGLAAQAGQADGGVQFGAADLHVEAAGLLEAAEVGRRQADHRLAEGDHVGHGLPHSGLRVWRTILTYSAARTRMRSKSRSATAFGSTSWLPMPRQQAPAFRKPAAVARSTPPVGMSRTCGSGP